MRTRGGLAGAVALALLAASPGDARAQAPPPLPLLDGKSSSADALAAGLRRLLAEHIPPVLIEDDRAWGRQKLVTRGLEWKDKGNPLPRAQKSHKNHGVWRKVKVTTVNPRETLAFDLRDARQAGPDRMTFTAHVAFDARVEYDQQNWRAGVRLYSGTLRARLRVQLTLYCEVSSRIEKSATFVPDVVFRARVLRADLRYDHFVVEHVAGVGGELAKLIGSAAQDGLHRWRPSLERK